MWYELMWYEHMCMWKSVVDIQYLSPSLSILFFDSVCHQTGSSLIPQDWLASEFKRSACLYPLHGHWELNSGFIADT